MMKVYELMNILADMPSGADVLCGGTLAVNELKTRENGSSDDNENDTYSFAKDVSDVKNADGFAYIHF